MNIIFWVENPPRIILGRAIGMWKVNLNIGLRGIRRED